MPTARHAEALNEIIEVSRTADASWVSASLGRKGLIASSVIFPAQPAALTPRPLRHFRSLALLRLARGPRPLASGSGRGHRDQRSSRHRAHDPWPRCRRPERRCRSGPDAVSGGTSG